MPKLPLIALMTMVAACSTKPSGLATIPPPPQKVSEGCPLLPELAKGQHIVEWGITAAQMYADCRDRVRLAKEAWPK